jgi:hypothetical protein
MIFGLFVFGCKGGCGCGSDVDVYKPNSINEDNAMDAAEQIEKELDNL